MTRTPPHILTLVALTAVSALSANVFLPSLNGMARYFDVPYPVMQLSVTAYLGASALVQLLAGPLSDRYGRRVVMLGALGVFLLASAGTLVAPNAGWFLACRMAQAAVTTGFVLSRAVVRDVVGPERSASLIGYVTMGMALVPMLSPILGGQLEELYGWRASFLLLLVLGVVVFLWTWRDMGETLQGTGLPMRAQFVRYPILARSVRFWGYCVAATLNAGAFYAYLGGAPFVAEQVFGLTPAVMGYWFAAPSTGYLLGNAAAGRFSGLIGMNRMVLLGSSITFAAMSLVLAYDLAAELRPFLFFGAVALMGLGNGMALPNAIAGMMAVRPELAGTASGFGGALMVAGGAGLAALAGVMLVPGAGAVPLLAIMAGSAGGAVLAILWVMRRTARLS